MPTLLAFGVPEMLLDNAVKSTFQDAAKKLTGHRKREFMAKVAEDYLQGSARKAERVLGWNRKSAELSLHERCTRSKLESFSSRFVTDVRDRSLNHLSKTYKGAEP